MLSKIMEFLNYEMACAMGLFIVGHLLVWYTHNLQFVWDFWKDRPILSNILFGLPAGICFWYGTRFCIQATELLWTSRFIAFSLSYVTFPIMTWYYLNESMFTTKTLICSVLAFLIVMVQIFVK